MTHLFNSLCDRCGHKPDTDVLYEVRLRDEPVYWCLDCIQASRNYQLGRDCIRGFDQMDERIIAERSGKCGGRTC